MKTNNCILFFIVLMCHSVFPDDPLPKNVVKNVTQHLPPVPTVLDKNDGVSNKNKTEESFHHSREGITNTEGGNTNIKETEHKTAPNHTVSVSAITSKVPTQQEEPNLMSTEGTKVSTSSIHARKGVDNTFSLNLTTTNRNSTVPQVYLPEPPSNKLNGPSESNANKTDIATKINVTLPETSNNNSTSTVSSSLSSSTVKKPVPKKPLITVSSVEAFPQFNLILDSKEMPSDNSNSALPQKDTASGIKNNENDSVLSIASHGSVASAPHSVQDNLSKNQPGFIVPLVITMFAIPLLGFVGYQAIRRGRDAWKNRHYRRMDFLIDGMYND